MTKRKRLSSTQTPPTSLTCGKRRCSKTLKTRGRRRGSRRWSTCCYLLHSTSHLNFWCTVSFALLSVLIIFCQSKCLICLCCRSRGAVWTERCKGRSKRFAKRGIVGRSGTWWLWIRSWGRTTGTPFTETEGRPLRAQCHLRTGTWAHTLSWFAVLTITI